MISDAELEAALSAGWINFLAAVRRDDPSASRLWRELRAIHDQKTPEQRVRYLVLAGLTPDGRPLDSKPGGAA